MNKKGKIQRIQKAIDQSIIYSMIINPSSFTVLNKYLKRPVENYLQIQNYQKFSELGSYLIEMNPLLFDDMKEEEKEINLIIQEDKIELLKRKLVNHTINKNYKDGKGISLIEKCVFFNSEKCIDFLLDENVSIKDNYEGRSLMEFAAMKGNKKIIDLCLKNSLEIDFIDFVIGLMAHQNEVVDWMFEKTQEIKFYNTMLKTQIFGFVDNIEFNETFLKDGFNINEETEDKLINYKMKHH